jgi:HD-like signal output (HDOD) protein
MHNVVLLTERRSEFREKALRSVGGLPPFSPTLNRLLATLAHGDVSFAKVGDLIEKDTVVAGNVLHLVNSALYARRGTINSVRHAVSLLGINKLRNAVLGMSIARMWNKVTTPPGWSMGRFNQHAAATAILADLLAQNVSTDYPEGAFVAGLLHDVGRLLIALGLPDQHSEINTIYERGSRTLVECEMEVIGLTHPELSAAALEIWNLPLPIQTAVNFHHLPEADNSSKPGVMPLSRVVDGANQFVNAKGISISSDPPADAADPIRIGQLGLDEDRVVRLVTDFQAEYDSMLPFFK